MIIFYILILLIFSNNDNDTRDYQIMQECLNEKLSSTEKKVIKELEYEDAYKYTLGIRYDCFLKKSKIRPWYYTYRLGVSEW